MEYKAHKALEHSPHSNPTTEKLKLAEISVPSRPKQRRLKLGQNKDKLPEKETFVHSAVITGAHQRNDGK